MIDIHCHVLPGIDDGAKTLKDTLTMLKSAVDEGITAITATPHHSPKYNNEASLILEKVKEVQNIIFANRLPITVLPGQEIRICGDLLKDYTEHKLLTSAADSSYMLIEFPPNYVPKYAGQLLYDMKLQGLQPILVHPERNREIIEKPNLLYQFVDQGILSQITASSVTGHFGKEIQKLTFQMVENHLTHFIASDAHNVSSRDFHMKEAFEIIEKKFGSDTAQNFEENSHLIILDQDIYLDRPIKIKM